MNRTALWSMIRHECRIFRTDGTAAAAVLAMALTLIAGALGSARWLQVERQSALTESAGQRQRVEELKARLSSPEAKPIQALSVMGQIGAVEILLPRPVAFLSIGHGDVLPSRYRQSTTTTDESIAQTANLENPSYLQTGRFDLSFVLVYLYPLFVLAMSYDVISSEREKGTLALALSQPISIRTWIAVRLAVRFVAITAAVTAIVLATSLVLAAPLTDPETALSIVLWFAAMVGYGAVWFTVAAFANLFSRAHSSVNAIVVGSAWILLVLILPMTVNVAASFAHPLPSRVALIGAFRTAEDASRGEGNGLVLRHYTEHPDLIPDGAPMDKADLSIMLYKVNREAERLADPVLERFGTQLRRQRRLVDRYTWLSPAMSMQTLLDEIAGTGTARYERFRQQVLEFNRRWHAHFEPLIFQKAALTVTDVPLIPRFDFHEEPFVERAQRVLWHLLAILFPVLLLSFAVGRLTGSASRFVM
jgi:ABC-2 type transport system permease protein